MSFKSSQTPAEQKSLWGILKAEARKIVKAPKGKPFARQRAPHISRDAQERLMRRQIAQQRDTEENRQRLDPAYRRAYRRLVEAAQKSPVI